MRRRQLADQTIEVRLVRGREIDAIRVGEPLGLEPHERGDDLQRNLTGVDVRTQRAALALGVEDRPYEATRGLVPVDEEVVQRRVRLEALRAQDGVQPRERGGLGVVTAEIVQGRERQRAAGFERASARSRSATTSASRRSFDPK